MKMRGKLQVKRIEDKNSRHVTFSKRRSGLIKKAKELSVLCDVELAVFVFSGKGKLYQFSTANRCCRLRGCLLFCSLRKILERCQMQKEVDIACGSAQYAEKIPQKQMDIEGDTNPLQAIQRYLEEQKVEQLDVAEITQLEHKLDVILHQLKTKKSQLMMEAVSVVHEKEKQLRGGNQSVQQEVQIAAMMNEGQYQTQQSQEDNNPLTFNDIDELFAANENDIPLYLQPFYML